MALVEEKLQQFREVILQEAEAKAGDIRRDADAKRKEALAQTEKKQEAEMKSYVAKEKDEIATEMRKSFSRFQGEMRSAYLLERQSQEEQIFQLAAQKLNEFVASQDYVTWFLQKVANIGEKKFSGQAVFFVAPFEKIREEQIGACYRGACHVEEDRRISIGGFRYENREVGYAIDETLDNRLQLQQEWLHQNIKLPR